MDKKRKIILGVFMVIIAFSMTVNCVNAVKTEKTKLQNSKTDQFYTNNGKISNHVTYTKNFKINNVLKSKVKQGYNTPYTGYLKANAYNKKVKIKKITVQLYNVNRGVYYKTFKGNNKHSQTIKLGNLVTANVHDPGYEKSVIYNIKFDIPSSQSWKKFDSGTKKFNNGLSFSYISYKKSSNSIKTKIYGPNMMTGKINVLYNTFTIAKSGSKWKAVSNDGFTNKKSYPKTYSLQKAHKSYLNYALRKLSTGGQ